MKTTISVIVFALNEERNIQSTVSNIQGALGSNFSDYEILLFDDGSTDGTGRIMEECARQDNKVKVIHNGVNRGVGYCCQRGLETAGMEYFSILPGDNEITRTSIKEMFDAVGKADIIVPFTINLEVRSRFRIILSHMYVFIMGCLFRCDLHYYTGPAIFRRKLLNELDVRVSDISFISASLVRLVRMGCSFLEVPIYIKLRTSGTSKILCFRHVVSVFASIAKLFVETEIKHRDKYRNWPVRRVIPALE